MTTPETPEVHYGTAAMTGVGNGPPAEAADATSADHLAEQTDNDPTPDDGPQDLPQEPVAEGDVEDD